MFATSSFFVIIFVWTGSSLYRHVTAISLYLSVTKPHISRNNTVLNYTSNNKRYIPVHLVASELRLPICCLLPAIHTISRCNSVSSFSHTGKITTFQKIKKQIRRTDRYVINFAQFPSLSLESPSVATSVQYVLVEASKENTENKFA